MRGIGASLVAPSRGNYSAMHDDTRMQSTTNVHIIRTQSFLLLSVTSVGGRVNGSRCAREPEHRPVWISGARQPRRAPDWRPDRPVAIQVGRLAGQLNWASGGCAPHRAGTTLTGKAAGHGLARAAEASPSADSQGRAEKIKGPHDPPARGKRRRRRAPPIGPLPTAIRPGTRAGPRDSGGRRSRPSPHRSRLCRTGIRQADTKVNTDRAIPNERDSYQRRRYPCGSGSPCSWRPGQLRPR